MSGDEVFEIESDPSGEKHFRFGRGSMDLSFFGRQVDKEG